MLLEVLNRAALSVVALDGDQVVGFVYAVSDGVLAAYLPLLEVLPAFQGRGIGRELVARVLGELQDLYMVDVMCDEELLPFYEAAGLQRASGAIRRNYRAPALGG